MTEILLTKIPGSLDEFFKFVRKELRASHPGEFKIMPEFLTDDKTPNATADADLIGIVITATTSIIIPLIFQWFNQKSFDKIEHHIVEMGEAQRQYSLDLVLKDDKGNKTKLSYENVPLEDIRKKLAHLIDSPQ